MIKPCGKMDTQSRGGVWVEARQPRSSENVCQLQGLDSITGLASSPGLSSLPCLHTIPRCPRRLWRCTWRVAVSRFSLELCFFFLMSDWVSLPLSSLLPCQYLQATTAQQCPCSVPSPWGFSLGCTVPTTCSDLQKYPTGHLCLFFFSLLPLSLQLSFL